MRTTYKFISLVLSIAVIPAYAAEYSNVLRSDAIHTAHVNIIGHCCPAILVSTKVGHMHNGKCNYEKETKGYDYGYCGPTQAYPLSGERLKALVGSSYDCAATHAYTDGLFYQGTDEFSLISSSDNYVGSSPIEGRINLNIKCGE
jgi:hypothetical protein